MIDILLRKCVLHGQWIYPDSNDGRAAALLFAQDHAECRWPVSTRRFPPKSRKRVQR